MLNRSCSISSVMGIRRLLQWWSQSVLMEAQFCQHAYTRASHFQWIGIKTIPSERREYYLVLGELAKFYLCSVLPILTRVGQTVQSEHCGSQILIRKQGKATGYVQLLLVDGHNSHYIKEFLAHAYAHDIHLLCYPVRTKHIYQRLDVVIFGPLKQCWLEEQDLFKSSTGQRITKQTFVTIYIWESPPKGFDAQAHSHCLWEDKTIAIQSQCRNEGDDGIKFRNFIERVPATPTT